jgi:hypothetical protein
VQIQTEREKQNFLALKLGNPRFRDEIELSSALLVLKEIKHLLPLFIHERVSKPIVVSCENIEIFALRIKF